MIFFPTQLNNGVTAIVTRLTCSGMALVDGIMAIGFHTNEVRLLRKTVEKNQVSDQRFSLKQWFAGGAQSRGLRKPGCGHCYLRFFDF